MKTVFLSASFPDPTRPDASVPYFPADIAAAASATIEATLRRKARLLLGGHPTISPIVLNIAAMLNAGSQVTIYQSDFFRKQLTEEVLRLASEEKAEIVFTPSASNLSESLHILRVAMLSEHIDAAFFIGGMSGIIDEYKMLAELHPKVPCLSYQAPGGASAHLWELTQQSARESRSESLIQPLPGRAYGSLALQAMRSLNIGSRFESDEL